MKKTIGILAHVDAGKTTFSEQLLYHTKSIDKRGRVDHKDAFLDSHDIERQRGITVFSDQGMFTIRDSTYYLIDTPGHIDFSPEMERAIQIMDYAIIIISAAEGIEGHTETVWELLRKHEIPTFFFVNKTDRVGADVNRVIEEVKRNLTVDVCDLTDFKNNVMSEEIVEFVAERDESLLESYFENGYEHELSLKTLQTLIANNTIFPLLSGSALHDHGIKHFLELVDQLTLTNYTTQEPFSGRVYKIRHDEKGARITFIKALSGTLKVRDPITYGDNEDTITEKIAQIRRYNGHTFKTVDQVQAGEIFAVIGLSFVSIGDGIGHLKEKATYNITPTLRSNVTFSSSLHKKDVLQYFKRLEVEDPSLNVIWEESLQEIHIHVMGEIQLEILVQVVRERFGIDVQFEKPEVIYKETIASEVTGYGHFEPLGHYAEVHLLLQPGERNSGITFDNHCHADDMTIGNQNLILHHLFEREHHGLLTGSALTDCKVTLLTGRAHNKHTSGGDFREATYRALRQGLEKASNQLLEPFYRFKIKVDVDQMGRVLSDVQHAYGSYDSPQIDADKAIITGVVPVATFMNYSSQLASFTLGKGTINLVFAGYDTCHNEEAVIERIGYNKNADPEYSSSSIFCTKGKGYTVTWDEAEEAMHCLK